MIIENFKIALAAILANKVRSGLTILGIVIGIAAVIAMLSVGQSAGKNISSSIEKMGTNILTIRPGLNRQRMVQTNVSQRLTFTDFKALEKRLKSLALVAPEVTLRGQLKFHAKNINTSVSGVNEAYFKARNFKLNLGSFFNEQKTRSFAKICVIGQTVQDNLGLINPVGETIRINRTPFLVIGTYEARGGSGFNDEDDQVFIPITTAKERLIGDDNLRNIYVSVINKSDTDKVTEIITATLRKEHKLGDEKEDDFSIRSQLELLETMQGVTRSFTILLGSIALISLIVGGIGIMNILLVSVTERTKEIGIRKAIGAYESDILKQFLIEALVLCIIGGIIGIILGVIIAWAISFFTTWPLCISPISIFLAVGVSSLTGLFFGYYPAKKAAKMNPIDALRYE
ncbi:MAG: ABC transporter permease [Candidatus Margulisiibacteriota bacterium]|jgi:putative ABC transport system permease protein